MFSPILYPHFLKHLQLLNRRHRTGWGLTIKNLHHTKLLVSDTHNPYVPFIRKYLFNPGNMYVCVFPAAAMPHINGELKHLKSIFQYVLTELCVYFTLLFGFRRKIKKYQHPQYTVCI